MKVLSLIPARGGSKGVKKKNIRLMAGRPLIDYTIQISIQSKVIDRIIVSTDDPEIASISKRLGAEVPFIRPGELAQDITPDFPVVEHCLNYLLNNENWVPDILFYMRPTMPLRKKEEIEMAVKIFVENKDVDAVRSTCPAPYPPYWMKKINNKGFIEPFDKIAEPFKFSRRQDLPEIVICDGYIDASRVEAMLKSKAIVSGNIFPIHRTDVPFIDIDTKKDWEYCEYYLTHHIN